MSSRIVEHIIAMLITVINDAKTMVLHKVIM